jgi:hypothetical protein
MFVNPKLVAEANNRPENQAALSWLKKAKVSNPPEESLHLLALAQWGMERGATAPGLDDGQNASLKEAVDRMWAWNPTAFLTWLETNPEGPESRLEQQRSLLRALEGVSSPESAAEVVLEAISSRLAAQSQYYQSAASELR